MGLIIILPQMADEKKKERMAYAKRSAFLIEHFLIRTLSPSSSGPYS